MKLVTVNVIGIRPIFFHAFKIEAISDQKKVKSGTSGNNPDEWKSTVLERGGQLYIPGSYWSGCLKEGSRYTKAGRGTIQKSFISSTIVLSDISLLDRHLPENWQEIQTVDMSTNSDSPVFLDIRGVMNPNTKGKNVRYRIACSIGWKTEFKFSFDDSVISQSQIKKVLEDSGKMVGVGDARVLGYGRFKIENVKIEELKED